MMKSIRGSFEVKLRLIGAIQNQTDLSRMEIAKSYEGPLSGKSKGEMLAVKTDVDSSAGYVAIEKFTGTLKGKTGSFVLQHFGMMSGGNDRLILELVPDSGTEELKGISGKMEINRDGSDHKYVFKYELT